MTVHEMLLVIWVVVPVLSLLLLSLIVKQLSKRITEVEIEHLEEVLWTGEEILKLQKEITDVNEMLLRTLHIVEDVINEQKATRAGNSVQQVSANSNANQDVQGDEHY